jgi:hypothetical protein
MLRDSDWRNDDCFLIMGDNTTALGWIKKSNFKPETDHDQATHLALARHITTLLADLRITQSGQWLPGADNGVADTLSHQHEQSDAELTDFIVKSFPAQIQNEFRTHARHDGVTAGTIAKGATWWK